MTEEEKEEFLNKKKEKDGCIADARLLYSDKLDGVWTHFMEFFKPHIVQCTNTVCFILKYSNKFLINLRILIYIYQFY